MYERANGNFSVDSALIDSARLTGVITGLVTVAGAPAWRRVRLFRDIDGQCMGEKWSDPKTGAVTFTGLNSGHAYTGLAYDHTGTYQSMVWNGVTPV
jgi:hypothetical protein